MRENFPASYKLVRASEGGNDDDPDDSGGRTSRGILQKEYTPWLKEKGRPNCDVWKAPEQDIHDIYFEEYWLPVADKLPIGVDYLFFDLHVNGGLGRAAKILQLAVGFTGKDVDGHVGPMTRAAVSAMDPVTLIKKFTSIKEDWYRSIAHGRNAKFLKGWINRSEDVLRDALKMVKG